MVQKHLKYVSASCSSCFEQSLLLHLSSHGRAWCLFHEVLASNLCASYLVRSQTERHFLKSLPQQPGRPLGHAVEGSGVASSMVLLLHYQWGHYLNLVTESTNVIHVQQPLSQGDKKKRKAKRKKKKRGKKRNADIDIVSRDASQLES